MRRQDWHQRVSRAPAGWPAVAVFLAIAFGLSWAVQIVIALQAQDLVEGQDIGASQLLVAAALMFPPAIGAYVVRRWIEGRHFEDAGIRRPQLRLSLVAWFGPAVLVVLALLISLPIYPFGIDENDTQGLSPGLFVAVSLVSALTIGVLINSIFAFGEEYGWRGYLLPRLVALMGFWPGLLAHGAIWGFWHAPLIALAGYNYPDTPLLGVLLFTAFGTLAGILFGWLQIASDSVWPPTIAHGAINSIAGLPFLLLVDVNPSVAGALHSPIGWLVLLGVIAVLLWRGWLTRPRESAPARSPAAARSDA